MSSIDDGGPTAGCVVDRRSSPSIASTKPLATASPRPRPSWASGPPSPSRWKGWNTASRLSAGMPDTAVDHSDVDAVSDGCRLRRGRSCPSGAQLTAFWMTFASARSRRTPSARTSGSVSGTSTSTPAASSPEAGQRGVDGTSTATVGSMCDAEHPRLHPAEVEQVDDQRGESVGFGVDGLGERLDVVGAPSRPRAEEAGGRRLDVGERPAQIMGHGGEEGVA